MALAIAMPLAVFAEHSGETPAPVPSDSTSCVITRSLGLGNRGADVSCLQETLIAAAFLKSTHATGYFGSATKDAVRHWQEHAGLPATGYFGAMSRLKFSASSMHHSEQSHAAPAGTTTAMHAHMPVDVSSWSSVPSVTIVLHPDSMSGYNLEIVPVNFRFAPEHVNGAVVPNEGHTHLMVNGTKLARVYGPWFHIGKEHFATGTNEVLVTLNANDHSDLVAGGVRIEAKQSVTIK